MEQKSIYVVTGYNLKPYQDMFPDRDSEKWKSHLEKNYPVGTILRNRYGKDYPVNKKGSYSLCLLHRELLGEERDLIDMVHPESDWSPI